MTPSPERVGKTSGQTPGFAKWALMYPDASSERLSIQYDVHNTFWPDQARIIWNDNDDHVVYVTAEDARWLAERLLDAATAMDTLSTPSITPESKT